MKLWRISDNNLGPVAFTYECPDGDLVFVSDVSFWLAIGVAMVLLLLFGLDV
jgi:hypothetical protein